MADSYERLSAAPSAAKTLEARYSKLLLLTDTVAIAAGVFAGQYLWFGTRPVIVSVPNEGTVPLEPTYTFFSLGIVVAWLLALQYFDSRDVEKIGTGFDEYRRVIDATIRLIAIVAVAMFLLSWELGRGYFLTAIPLGLLLLLLGRWSWRRVLQVQRARGRYAHRALLVGERSKSSHVLTSLARDRNAGFIAVGAVTGEGSVGRALNESVPVLGSYDDVLSLVAEHSIDAVILTGADELTPERMRRLSWSLEGTSVDLIVAPALTGVGGPRIHTRPVAGLPLIYVEFPRFEGRRRAAKRIFDVVGSSFLLLLGSPIFLAAAIAVKVNSPGSVFYRQERIGRHGEPFGMLKFRSMVQGADDQLKSLLDEQGTSDKPLFKINNDPRVTRVGRFIRRYSIDELPQLVNVFLGEMSLVGPRPQRAAEVALYDDIAHRRHFMKPGMSGLWQVSGRSSLSWEDAIRLDLYYVENWSMTADVIILWRTLRAVVKADGAH